MSSDTLFVFGDQSQDLLPSIRRLHRQCQQNSSLRHFMRSATDLTQHLLSEVPTHIRPVTPPFDSLLQLAEAIDNGSQSTPLISSLLAITQIGNLIVYLSTNPCALDRSQSAPAFLGVCAGSLLAAIAASCRNVTELLDIAPQVIVLSFYTSLEAHKRSRAIEVSEESWASIIKDVDLETLQEHINSFNQDLEDQMFYKRIYISAIGESCVTISGPPSVVQRFFNNTLTIKEYRRIQLPIKSAFHARHLVSVPHSRIFEHSDTKQLQRQICHPLLSCCGSPYKSSRLNDVLHEIIDEILQQPIDWRQLTNTLPTVLRSSATVISIGPFQAPSALSRWRLLPSDDHTLTFDALTRHSQQREGSGGIAIVGMSIRAPGSETLEEFWDVLQKGKDLHQQIPLDRFDINTHYDQSGRTKNSTLTPYGVFIDRPGFFDPRFFNMSPREALQTDPQQRLMLLTTYEALENAGYSPNRTPSSSTRRIASFVGQTGDDYREFNANKDINTHFITGNIRAFGPGRLNYHFGWEGPSYSIDTACSSSGASIQLACSSLLSRECDTAVTGGANLLTSPDLFAGLSRGGFLSKTGGCKTFDRDADGYVRGEGCGILILKRLEDALADRDNVLAVIKGARTNHSAEAISITHPHEKTQERLFRAVLADAGVHPHQVDLAEMHGTGTQAGDGIESRSVTNVLCEGRGAKTPLIMSTVKPNIGHGEAASGVSSVIKAVLMMQKDTIPPHVGIKTSISDKLPMSEVANARICLEQSQFIPHTRGDGKRRILVNNFDAAGGNTSMLIEDSPKPYLSGQDPRSRNVVAFSAKSSSAMANNIRKTLNWLKCAPDTRIEDISYTTTSRRMHYSFRKAYTAASTKELISVLETQDTAFPTQRISSSSNAVFCFTGQGSQYLKMGLQLYVSHQTFRECIEEYASICDSYQFPSFLPILHGDAAALDCPIRTQLATVATELALASLWKSWGIQASAVVGHSIGEYSALCCAGVISISDCLYLIGKRAELITRSCTPNTHAMLAVQADGETIKQLTGELPDCKTEVACINGPRSTVISGLRAEIESANKLLQRKGITTKFLPIQHAFHSSQLDPILQELEDIACNITYCTPKIPVASTTLGEVITSEGMFNCSYVRAQTRAPVRFQDAINALFSTSLANEATVWIELGPNPTCLGMLKAVRPGVQYALPSLQKDRNDWQVLTSTLALSYNAGLNVDWNEFHRPFEQSLQLLQLPNYSFDLKDYWMSHMQEISPERHLQTSGPELTAAEQQQLFRPTQGLQRIEKFESDLECIKVIFAADTAQPGLNRALSGHLVNGEALCPSSVYADMAFAVASYFRQLEERYRYTSIQVDNMEVTKPLILNLETTDQVIRITATKKRSSPDIQLHYTSQNGRIYENHATCTARLCAAARCEIRPSESENDIRANIERLKHASFQGKAHRILRSMVYKLFKTFVDYDRDYQGLEEVFLNAEMLEAAALVNFQSENVDFACNPYWIDSIAHLSGFILNGSEFTPDESVFISHGWESLRIMQILSPGKIYQSYVRMHPSSRRTIFTGNVYLLDEKGIAAICQGVKFQQINRNVLDHIIPSTGSTPLMARSKGRQSVRLLPTSWKRGPSGTPAAGPVKSLPLNMTLNKLDMGHKDKPIIARGHIPSDARIRDVLAHELGVDVDELEDNASFADLGVDSLLTMSLLSSLNEVVEEQLPASLFIQFPTVGDLCQRMQQSPQMTNAANSPKDDHHEGMSYEGEHLGAMTPATEYGDCDESCLARRNILTEIMRKIVAEEIGISTTEIDDDASLLELGVDSLFTFSILTRVKEQTGMTLASTFFVEHPTFRYIEQTLQDAPPSLSVNIGGFEKSPCVPLTPPTRTETAAEVITRGGNTQSSSSVLLQGSSECTYPALFLIPDGSGSPSSYAKLPCLNYTGAVYGLNSPFIDCPQSFEISLHELVALYVAEIRRIQPEGPYHVGGWSIGGICAFEAASQLIREHGQEVPSLILIDAPCPKIFPPLPLEEVDFLQSIGVFDKLQRNSKVSVSGPVYSTGMGLRDGIQKHFASSIRALEKYNFEVLNDSQAPKSVMIVWARDGVWETLSSNSQITEASRSKSQHATTSWLMDTRSDFGTCGWEELLPMSKFTCRTVPGDHFSMMRHAGVLELGAKISSFRAAGLV